MKHNYILVLTLIFSILNTPSIWGQDDCIVNPFDEEEQLEYVYFLYKTNLKYPSYKECDTISWRYANFSLPSSTLPISTMDANFDTIISNAEIDPNYRGFCFRLTSSFPIGLSRYNYRHNFNVKRLDYDIATSRGEQVCINGSSGGTGWVDYVDFESGLIRELVDHSISRSAYLDSSITFSGHIEYELSYITDYQLLELDSTAVGKEFEFADGKYKIISMSNGMLVLDDMLSDTIPFIVKDFEFKYSSLDVRDGDMLESAYSYDLSEVDSIKRDSISTVLKQLSMPSKYRPESSQDDDIETRIEKFGELGGYRSMSTTFAISEKVYTNIINNPAYRMADYASDIQDESNQFFVFKHRMPKSRISIWAPNYHKRTFVMKL